MFLSQYKADYRGATALVIRSARPMPQTPIKVTNNAATLFAHVAGCSLNKLVK